MYLDDLPHSVEAEKAALGSMLISSQALTLSAEKIKPEAFYIFAHRTIYEEMLNLWKEGVAIDLVTFTQVLRDKSLLDKVGGHTFLNELFIFVPSASNIEYYLGIIIEKQSLRGIINVCNEATKAAREQDDPDSILSQAQSDLMKVGAGESVEKKTIKEYTMDALDAIEEAYKNKGKIVGLSTGLTDLDRMFGGMRPGHFIVIAGPTGGGKTSLGLKIIGSIAISVASEARPVGIISLEMSGQEIAESLIGSIGKVDMHEFARTGRESEFPKITGAVNKLMESLIHIRDDSDVDFTKLRAMGREMRSEHKIELLVVDYIQLLLSVNTKEENRERAMATAAQTCKQMARELGIPVIGNSQLNDAGKLRESRAIGHHADKVALIRHDEDEPGKAYLDIDKNRRGPTGSVPVTWIAKYSTFENAAAEKLIFDKK